jgi:hypothetical protein
MRDPKSASWRRGALTAYAASTGRSRQARRRRPQTPSECRRQAGDGARRRCPAAGATHGGTMLRSRRTRPEMATMTPQPRPTCSLARPTTTRGTPASTGWATGARSPESVRLDVGPAQAGRRRATIRSVHPPASLNAGSHRADLVVGLPLPGSADLGGGRLRSGVRGAEAAPRLRGRVAMATHGVHGRSILRWRLGRAARGHVAPERPAERPILRPDVGKGTVGEARGVRTTSTGGSHAFTVSNHPSPERGLSPVFLLTQRHRPRNLGPGHARGQERGTSAIRGAAVP